MTRSTAIYWLSVSLLLVAAVFDLTHHRHGFASAVGEFQPPPAMATNLGGVADKRRQFMFGRRNFDEATGDDWWNGQSGRRTESRRRFKFGKKSAPATAAAEKRKLLMFGKKRSSDVDDYYASENKRMFKFGKRN